MQAQSAEQEPAIQSASEHPAIHSTTPSFFQSSWSFLTELFDFQFKEVMTVKMLPLIYGVAILSIAATTLYLGIHAALTSYLLGIVYCAFIAPVFFIFSISAVRTTLEFFSALFSVQHQMQKMNMSMEIIGSQLKKMNENTTSMETHTATMAETLNELNGVTDKIPFFKKPKKTNKHLSWAEAPLKDHLNNTAE